MSEEVTLHAAYNQNVALRLELQQATGCVQLVGVTAAGEVIPVAILDASDLNDLVDAAISLQIEMEESA